MGANVVACSQPDELPDLKPRQVSSDFELDLAKQKAIWDAEHVTFVVERRLGQALRDAWQAGDLGGLDALCLADFKGQRPADATAIDREQAGVHEWQLPESDDPEPLSTDKWTEFMVGLMDRFGEVQSTSMRVLRIHPMADRTGGWSARLFLSARGNSPAGLKCIQESIHEVEFEFDDEAQLGKTAALRRWSVESVSHRVAARSLFEEVTSDMGLDILPLVDNWNVEPAQAQQYRFQMAVDDFDRDGYPDIAVATYKGRPLLLRNIRGRQFTDVASQMGLQSWKFTAEQASSVVAWTDFDNDGYPDLVMGRYFYRNNEGKGFEDITEESGLIFKREPMGCAVIDYDCDGLLDLYMCYELPDKMPTGQQVLPWIGDDKSGESNQLWHNEGNGTFRDVTIETGSGAGLRKTTAMNWLFYDDDAYPDAYLANDFGTNVLLRNKGDGTFEDISQESGTSDYATSMGVASGDLDNDGYPEIYIANMFSKMGRRIIDQVEKTDYPGSIYEQIKGSCAGNRLYRHTADNLRCQEFSTAWKINRVGWAYSPAMVDLDGDGFLDLYASTGFMSFDRRKPDG
jgi:hypothetical protein